jgi:hypothetical protein
MSPWLVAGDCNQQPARRSTHCKGHNLLSLPPLTTRRHRALKRATRLTAIQKNPRLKTPAFPRLRPKTPAQSALVRARPRPIVEMPSSFPICVYLRLSAVKAAPVKFGEIVSHCVANVSENVARQEPSKCAVTRPQTPSNQSFTFATSPAVTRKHATPCDIPRRPAPSRPPTQVLAEGVVPPARLSGRGIEPMKRRMGVCRTAHRCGTPSWPFLGTDTARRDVTHAARYSGGEWETAHHL